MSSLRNYYINQFDLVKDIGNFVVVDAYEKLNELDVAKGLDKLNNLLELDNQLEAIIETT